MRCLSRAVLCAAVTLAGMNMTAGADGPWATVKGQVLFPKDKEAPKRAPLNVAVDQDHCLSKGALLDESVLVNAKNRGVKNVVVFLRPDSTDARSGFTRGQVHPGDAERKPAEVVIDQPCCAFVNRVTLARVGDTLVVKNSAPVAHNFFWDSANNGAHNATVSKADSWKLPAPFVKEAAPIQYKCSIHPWMTGYVRIFDHPYYALTDEDGKFEIKNAPVGKFRIVYWHENGIRGGAKGRFGDPIEITGPVTELKPIEFDVTPK